METTTSRISRHRALAPVSIQVLQKACAYVFLNNLCDKVQAHNGVCETLFERHRGDETPFARCNAKDEIWQDGDLDCITDEPKVPAMGDAPVGNHQLAVPPKQEARVNDKSKSTSSALKLYQTDFEIAALFVMPESELLISFKLLTPLARVDKCTGRLYAHLHSLQSDVLQCSARFNRIQRMHTSDGDKAQSLAERILENRRGGNSGYKVATFRNQCSVHRVYHIIGMGTALFFNFISGQIKLALSLRGPGNFAKFKEFFWKWILSCHEYIYEEEPRGPGAAADAHREGLWNTFFSHASKGRGTDETDSNIGSYGNCATATFELQTVLPITAQMVAAKT